MECSYTYSRELVGKAFWELCSLRYTGVFIGILVAWILAFFVAIGDDPLLWISGFLFGAGLVYIAVVMRSLRTAFNRSKVYQGMTMHLNFDEDGLSFTSPIVTSRYPSSSVSLMHKTHNFVFINANRSIYRGIFLRLPF